MTSTEQSRHSVVYPYAIPAKAGHKLGSYQHHQHHPYGNHSYDKNSLLSLSRSIAARRLSEGEAGRYREMLKCDTCGKGYKHTSSLAKHLWEHTPEWTMTKKLLISKHQQVQLLEAASILVGMNEPGTSFEDKELIPGSPFSRASVSLSLEHDEDGLSNFPEQIPSMYSPMPGCVGGYIDVPSRRFLIQEQATIDEQDEDEEIVGKME